MARKNIREYDAKKLLLESLSQNKHYSPYQAVMVDSQTDIASLPQNHPWLLEQKLVVKPDQLFGQRKKHGLVLANVSFQEATQFIQEKMGKEVAIGKATGKLTHFLIEPFIPHEQEYYLSFISQREHDTLFFSEQGGIDIEQHWQNVKEIKIPPLQTLQPADVEKLSSHPAIRQFIAAVFHLFRTLDFSYLEINPFTLSGETMYLLDTVAQVDDCASFRHGQEWEHLSFPKDFGQTSYPEEEIIEELDRTSGASLKLTILNPNGKIWNILGGGGASIIYLDMIHNLGQGKEIANYGESSGNPSEAESYEYAKAIIGLMLKNQGKVLCIIGGTANFTDIRETFKGACRAIEGSGEALRQKKVTIIIRRGGPHEKEGLRLIQETGERLGIPTIAHGPETSMPQIIKIAEKYLQTAMPGNSLTP